MPLQVNSPNFISLNTCDSFRSSLKFSPEAGLRRKGIRCRKSKGLVPAMAELDIQKNVPRDRKGEEENMHSPFWSQPENSSRRDRGVLISPSWAMAGVGEGAAKKWVDKKRTGYMPHLRLGLWRAITSWDAPVTLLRKNSLGAFGISDTDPIHQEQKSHPLLP